MLFDLYVIDQSLLVSKKCHTEECFSGGLAKVILFSEGRLLPFASVTACLLYATTALIFFVELL